jgi:hypothetical protein
MTIATIQAKIEQEDMMIRNCRVCGTDLVVGKNISQGEIDASHYTCRTCTNASDRAYLYRTGRQQPMRENKNCAAFLGIYVAEQVLSYIFKNVHRMPINNPGYDFVCNHGKWVDVKAACRHHHSNSHRSDNWMFVINKNPVAEYFLFIAFDNRKNLTPEHIWFIPADRINDKVSVNITESKLNKWIEYEQPIDHVVACCDTLRR